jgi:hypothetical protein
MSSAVHVQQTDASHAYKYVAMLFVDGLPHTVIKHLIFVPQAIPSGII